MDFVVGWVFWSNWGSCFLVSWSGKPPPPTPAPGEVLAGGGSQRLFLQPLAGLTKLWHKKSTLALTFRSGLGLGSGQALEEPTTDL